jgi:hypothetical protein
MIKFQPSNFNTYDSFILSLVLVPWYPVTNTQKQYRDVSIRREDKAKQTPTSPTGSRSEANTFSFLGGVCVCVCVCARARVRVCIRAHT